MPGTFAYTVSTNTVVVTGGTSGSPADFASFVTSDRAGTATSLKAASAPSKTFTLTYAVRPVELRAIVVKFIIAAKTAETDYLYITGTDAWDAAQTESIDVSAGNGTYTSTKRWRTISNISCSDAADGTGTVWADGTLAVTQDIWGVIWNYGYGQYRVDAAIFTVGDGSTSTYFTSKNELVTFPSFSTSAFTFITASATFQCGTLNAAEETDDGCYFKIYVSTGAWRSLTINGVFKSYGTTWDWINANNQHYLSLAVSTASGYDIQNSTFINIGSFFCDSYNSVITSGTIRRSTVANSKIYGAGFSRVPSTVTFVNNRSYNNLNAAIIDWGTTGAIIDSLYFNNNTTDLNLYNLTGSNTLLDPSSSSPGMSWGGSPTGNVKIKYRCDINICDKDGIAILGAVVDCEDKTGTAAWAAGTITTDASGNITQQQIEYKRFTYSGGTVTTTYSPHKFTISKAGYETLTLENITIDSPIDWHLELQDEPTDAEIAQAVWQYGNRTLTA